MASPMRDDQHVRRGSRVRLRSRRRRAVQASALSAAPTLVPARITPQPGANGGAATTSTRATVPAAAATGATPNPSRNAS
jgi:hypothetical protein